MTTTSDEGVFLAANFLANVTNHNESMEWFDIGALLANQSNASNMFSGEEPISRAGMIVLGASLKQIHDVILLSLLLFVMFSMGCGVTLRQILDHLRHPTAVLLCLFAQFFVVPLIAFVMIISFGLNALNAAGLLILSCCPGGVTSNIFTIFLQGDLPLSITMTSVATVAAVILMPLNTFIYGQFLNLHAVTLPITDMVSTLATVTVPVFIGLAVQCKAPKLAALFNRIGGYVGLSVLLLIMSLEAYMFPSLFQQAPAKIWVSVIALPIISFLAGLLFSRFFAMSSKISRTIGIEIGIKNVGSALTVITLSFTHEELRHVWAFPFLYAFTSFLMIFCVLIIKRVQEIGGAGTQHAPVPVHEPQVAEKTKDIDQACPFDDANNNLRQTLAMILDFKDSERKSKKGSQEEMQTFAIECTP